jgi:hypothetical protein
MLDGLCEVMDGGKMVDYLIEMVEKVVIFAPLKK